MRGEANRSGKRPRRFRLWHGPVAVFLVCLVGAQMFRWYWNYAFHQRVASLGDRGYPVTFEQLEAWYVRSPPGQDNAAELVLEAGDSYVDRLDRDEIKRLPLLGHGVTPRRGWALPADVKDVMERLVADNQDSLALLHRAARLEQCCYPMDWSPSQATPYPPLDVIRNGQLLCLSALLAFDDDRAEAGVESLLAALCIARSAGRVPTVYGSLVCMGIRRQAASSLEWGLSRVVLVEQQTRRLQEAMGTEDSLEGLTRSLVGHLCTHLPRFECPQLYREDYLPSATMLKAYEALGLGAKEGALFVDMMESYLDVTRKPFSQWQGATAALAVEWDETLRGCVLLSPGGRGAFSGLLMGHVESRARSEAARAALAVERYRLSEGTLPESLTDLVPRFLEGVPADPYAGGPMLYESRAGGFVVYSVGLDGRDDGGRETPEEKYDVTFTIKRKEATDDAGNR